MLCLASKPDPTLQQHVQIMSVGSEENIYNWKHKINKVKGGAALTLAFAAIGRVSVVTRHAGLTVRTGGEVATLLAHTAVHTRAVAVTLAC